ncbi:hypothetical protein FM076_32200 [Streptomyces albus subsp. chlorinus]|uniref:hypothetical protein n=1 Tax=Streptomyces albus TaxID=1888 RepID=UPI001D86C19A|nr:hypothetical protein [Streptomyces albus subsp. chlorinus]
MSGYAGEAGLEQRVAVSAAVAVTAVLPGAAVAVPSTVAGAAGDSGTGAQRISVAADGIQADGNSAASPDRLRLGAGALRNHAAPACPREQRAS